MTFAERHWQAGVPRIVPPGGPVDWPSEEGTLGVVGVAPWATLDFCRALYRAVAATKDWHFPRLLLDINTKIPSRGRHLQLGETDPSPAIAATIEELARQGATLAVVVCNTAHILHDRWARGAPIPVLHIIEETVMGARESGARRVAPLVSVSLARYDLYGERARERGLGCVRPGSAEQAVVDELISAVKVSGALDSAQQQAARRLLAGLKADGVDTVIAGCTELSVLEGACVEADLGFVDSNVALARAALGRMAVPADRVLPLSHPVAK
jgi:aspartate racemase